MKNSFLIALQPTRIYSFAPKSSERERERESIEDSLLSPARESLSPAQKPVWKWVGGSLTPVGAREESALCRVLNCFLSGDGRKGASPGFSPQVAGDRGEFLRLWSSSSRSSLAGSYRVAQCLAPKS